ncbi:hypothetical protein RJ55_04518 [Drechmeria coniospora]|nr:hypothetical protein RJ55_04518 [Drechmeria coniospora]
MKGLSMNRMLGSIKKKAGGSTGSPSATPPPASAARPAESPEVTAHNSVKAFCESGGNAQSDEVLFLPPIVDAAESSPAAAAECARIIRKFLGKDYSSRPSWQYNAIMLVRILTDNPGQTFTRNLDDKFVDTAKALLRNGKDPSVRQLLMETLDSMEQTKMYDEGLQPLIQMWKKEKSRLPPVGPRPPDKNAPRQVNDAQSQNYFAKAHSNFRLPDPVELASRLEEARTSAKLLEQVVMNTPPGEMLQNELIREFANRCISASRSIQGYMNSDNPAPDNDTMENLIDTNEQLQTALNQHHRAVLRAKKQLGVGSTDVSPSPEPNGAERQTVTAAEPFVSGGIGGKGKQTEQYSPPDGPPRTEASSSGYRREQAQAADDGLDDPFGDPRPGSSNSAARGRAKVLDERAASNEPYTPKAADSYFAEETAAANGFGASRSATGTYVPSPLTPRSGTHEDDDIYEATPRSQEPLYRY